MDNRELILKYIEEHGIIDKDSAADKNRLNSVRKPSKSARKNKPVKELDLHGKTSDEAEILIENLLKECSRNGIEKVRIIHGKGWHSDPGEGPVLKNVTLSLLANRLKHLVRDFLPAPRSHGGEGATVVYIKRN